MNKSSYFSYRLGRKRDTESLLLLFLFSNIYELLRYYADRGYISTKSKKGRIFFHEIFIPS